MTTRDNALSGACIIEVRLIGSRPSGDKSFPSRRRWPIENLDRARPTRHLIPPAKLCFVNVQKGDALLTDQFSRRARTRAPAWLSGCVCLRAHYVDVLSSSNQQGQPRNVITRPRTDVFYAYTTGFPFLFLSPSRSVVIPAPLFSFIRGTPSRTPMRAQVETVN